MGRIHVAAFTDEVLFNELLAKSTFWQQTHYFGVDLTCLHRAAHQGYMAQVVVDAVHPSVVCSTCHTHVVDFRTATEQDLYNICMKLELQVESALLPPGRLTWAWRGCTHMPSIRDPGGYPWRRVLV